MLIEPRTGVPKFSALLVGASAGGVEALSQILPGLPATTPWPVIVVIHLPPNQESLLEALFARKCELPCRQPYDKQAVTAGIWFAPPDYHLLIESDRTFGLSIEGPVNYSRPSVDVLFQSAAPVYREQLACVVLTGANHDGAAGAKAVRDAGGFVMVQDPDSAEVPTMPSEAVVQANPQLIGDLATLADFLRRAALEGASP